MKPLKGNGRIRILLLLVLTGLGDAPGIHEEPEWVKQGCEDHAIVDGLSGPWIYDCAEKRWVNVEEEGE